MMTTTRPDGLFSVTDSILSSNSRCTGESGDQEDNGCAAEQPTQPRTEVRRRRDRGPQRGLREKLLRGEESRPLHHMSARGDDRRDSDRRDLDGGAPELDCAEPGQRELLGRLGGPSERRIVCLLYTSDA